jgi:amidase
LLSTPEEDLDTFRTTALQLLYPASLAGLPQLTMPLHRFDDLPVGVSMIGPRGRDRALIKVACRLAGGLS